MKDGIPGSDVAYGALAMAMKGGNASERDVGQSLLRTTTGLVPIARLSLRTTTTMTTTAATTAPEVTMTMQRAQTTKCCCSGRCRYATFAVVTHSQVPSSQAYEMAVAACHIKTREMQTAFAALPFAITQDE